MNSQTLNGDDTVSYSGSDVSTADTNDFDDFLQRYTFTCNPEFCIKLRRSVGPVSLRANRYFGGRLDRWAFVVKPAHEERHRWLHKLAVEPANERASFSTSKIKIWEILRLQVVAHYDWDIRSAGLQWRVSSKWSRGQGKLGRKEKLRYDGLPAVQVHPHWRMDLFMPEVEGTLGGQRDQSVHLEKGHCHLSIPKLEILLDLNDIAGTKQDAAALLHRLGRRQPKVSAQEPIPSYACEAAEISGVSESGHNGDSIAGQGLHNASVNDVPPAASSSSSAWFALPQQRHSRMESPRQLCVEASPGREVSQPSPPAGHHPGQAMVHKLQQMWGQLTGGGAAR